MKFLESDCNALFSKTQHKNEEKIKTPQRMEQYEWLINKGGS